jgi:hypothetical protein
LATSSSTLAPWQGAMVDVRFSLGWGYSITCVCKTD